MSESLQSAPIETFPEDREKLYQLVWREPADRIAALYGISVELQAKRRSDLRIPRPLIGYWKALAKGTAPAIPALPALNKSRVESSEATIPHHHNLRLLSYQNQPHQLNESTYPSPGMATG